MNSKRIGKVSGFQIGGPKAAYVMSICSLLWMVNFMDRQVLTVVLQPMKVDLGLSDAQAGWITTAFLLSMAVFAIPVTYWVDRTGRKMAIGIMAIAWSLCTVIAGLGRSFAGVLLPRLGTGAAQSGFSSAAMALISSSYPDESRGKKMGVFNFFQILGISAGLILGGYLSANWGGWRTPLFVFAVPGIIVGILAFFMQDYPNVHRGDTGPQEEGLITSIKTLLKIPTLAWFYAGYTFFNATVFAVLGWLPSLIMRRFDIGEDTAGLIMAGVGLFAVPGVLLGGIWADKWEAEKHTGRMGFATAMVLCSTLSCVLAIVSMVFLHQGGLMDVSIWIIASAIMFALFSAMAAGVNPPVMAVSQTVVTSSTKSLSWGLCLSIVMLFGGAWSPTVAGYLSDWLGGGGRGLGIALIIVSSLGIGGVFCFWKSSLHYRQDVIKAKEMDAIWN